MRLRAIVAGIALCAVPILAAAQEVRVAGQAFNAQRRIYYRGTVYEQTGLWYGGAGSMRLGPVRVGVGLLMGTAGGTDAANPSVKIRTTAVTAHYAPRPWLALGVQAEARRFESDAGVVVWRLIGANARVEPGLGVPGLRGIADISVLPASAVTGGSSLSMAVQATMGFAWSPGAGPWELRLAYRFERYDIASGSVSPERYEQFRGVIAAIGIPIGR